jgi:hypothetical protein
MSKKMIDSTNNRPTPLSLKERAGDKGCLKI